MGIGFLSVGLCQSGEARLALALQQFCSSWTLDWLTIPAELPEGLLPAACREGAELSSRRSGERAESYEGAGRGVEHWTLQGPQSPRAGLRIEWRGVARRTELALQQVSGEPGPWR